jgi:hypothetical protein
MFGTHTHEVIMFVARVADILSGQQQIVAAEAERLRFRLDYPHLSNRINGLIEGCPQRQIISVKRFTSKCFALLFASNVTQRF